MPAIERMSVDGMRAHALRLRPGADLRVDLEALAREVPIAAGGVVSAVGSLSQARIRLAGAQSKLDLDGPLEILQLGGTLGAGGAHLHVLVGDEQGTPRGGHVLAGCIVHTTVELIVAELPNLSFDRVFDPATGFAELRIESQS